MADRRTSERLLLVDEHELERITPTPLHPLVAPKVGERLIVSPESLERLTPPQKPHRETEDRTEPMRLSFLALLAERDPGVQTRLNRRITPALELERARPEENVDDEDRPTDPMVLTAKFSG
jgi:hypothetical protein